MRRNDPLEGGWNGGATDIRYGGTGISNRVIVAGGGGGHGNAGNSTQLSNGGAGGYFGGGAGANSTGGGGGSGYIGGVSSAETIAGNLTIPDPEGGTMTGRAGNGLVIISW